MNLGHRILTWALDTPKKIYECDFPGCERQFVRQDLCTRHRERHTARGSHLQRKDPYTHTADGRPTLPTPVVGHREHFDSLFRTSGSDSINAPNNTSHCSTTPSTSHANSSLPGQSPLPSRIPGPQSHRSGHSVLINEHIRSPHGQSIPRSSEYGTSAGLYRSNSTDHYTTGPPLRSYDAINPINHMATTKYEPSNRNEMFEPAAPMQTQQYHSRPSHSRSQTLSSPPGWRASPASYTSSASSQYPLYENLQDSNGPIGYPRHQNFPPMLPLPPPSYPTANQVSVPISHGNFVSPHTVQPSVESTPGISMLGPDDIDSGSIDQQGNQYQTQAFEGNAYDRSPFALADDFAAWLFNDTQPSCVSPGVHRQGSMSLGATAFADEPVVRFPYGTNDEFSNGRTGHLGPQHPMAVTSIVDPAQTESILSEEKWQQLLGLIEKRFNETDHAPVRKQKEALLHGNREDSSHVLSLRMMQTYIGSYWYHFHPQMPILHKPTFSAEKAQNLLLVAVIAIGASCLDEVHGLHVTQAGAELSNFLAWHLRGELFKDKDFTPPAKLWVFQALLLLEIYEKMYSTRLLHERAHIHHGTTLTLLRRGYFLIGRSAKDYPPVDGDENPESPMESGPSAAPSHTPDQWWNHWITNEANRRVAFAAFIIDSIHATMFGHSATMVAHEMKLQLPCDESLWSATSSAEVGRMENSLQGSGIKPISFFDGLKDTLNNKPVRTNRFGRTALMAGLLSVSWHMNQRDLQVRSLGAKTFGGKNIWRGTLTKAFDFWKSDFDQSVGKDPGSMSTLYHVVGKPDEENIFESRTVAHHLAHMATHVDIVSCQIFARAKRLLGRTTLPSDYANAQRRIREHWAPRPSARDATFYSLKFLAQVLTPDTAGLKRSASEAGMGPPTTYSARDDFLINRPWVVYMAALIVWSYGYALDGALKSPPDLSSLEKQTYDMRLFLDRVGGVDAPDDLVNTPDRNACMGMLHILRSMFTKCRWELLHEGAKLLTNCIDMLRGSLT